jgi:hypothetical protein
MVTGEVERKWIYCDDARKLECGPSAAWFKQYEGKFVKLVSGKILRAPK